MRLNPFARPSNGGERDRYGDYDNHFIMAYDDEASEEDLGRRSRHKNKSLKQRRPSNATATTASRNTSRSGASHQTDNDYIIHNPKMNYSFAGGSAVARRHAAGGESSKGTKTRGRSPASRRRGSIKKTPVSPCRSLLDESEDEDDDIEERDDFDFDVEEELGINIVENHNIDLQPQDDDMEVREELEEEDGGTGTRRNRRQREVIYSPASDDMEQPPSSRRLANASRASSSRRSGNPATSRTYTLSTSLSEEEEEEEEEAREDNGNDDEYEAEGVVMPRHRRSRSVSPESNSRRRRSRSRTRVLSPSSSLDEHDYGGGRSRARSRSRSKSRSRAASSSKKKTKKKKSKNKHHHDLHSRRSQSASRRRRYEEEDESLDEYLLKNRKYRSASNAKRSWGLGNLLPFGGSGAKSSAPRPLSKAKLEKQRPSKKQHNKSKRDSRQEDHHREVAVPRKKSAKQTERRDASPHTPKQKAPKEEPVTRKRETYANLYEYDNFPAIDRVPTAIGFKSFDSNEEFEDDDRSFTSRYSVDVRSVRSSKLKKKRGSMSRAGIKTMDGELDGGGDDDLSNDEHDDKYAQYLAGADINPVMSDSSESCPPTWHPVLDVEESDWYDEDDDDEEQNGKTFKQDAKNKKYQVSDKETKSARKSKKEVANKREKGGGLPPKSDNDDDRNSPPGANMEGGDAEIQDGGNAETQEKDAIVANRSDIDDLKGRHSSRAIVPRDEFEVMDTSCPTKKSQQRRNSKHRRNSRGARGSTKNRRYSELDENDSLSDDSILEEATERTPRKYMKNQKKSKGKAKRSVKQTKVNTKPKSRGFGSKLMGFRRLGRAMTVPSYASESDESSISQSMGLAPSMSMYSEVDPSLAKLEEDERMESTATHNMIRNNKKEIAELDEMDDLSYKGDMNQMGCGAFPLFDFSALTLATNCNAGGQNSGDDGPPLDGVQIQRLKDAKQDLENKPKVEVILQDLQDPLAEKYDKLEKMQRKQKREQQKAKEAQEEAERKEREDLLRKKKEVREQEQRKIQMAQTKDLTLQEAPDLNRGKAHSFVMDITDWVLQLDNNGKPKRKQSSGKDKDTPRTNGREGNSSPVQELPFSTIEVPTTTTMESSQDSNNRRDRSKKKHKRGKTKVEGAKRSSHQQNSKKKSWFRRG